MTGGLSLVPRRPAAVADLEAAGIDGAPGFRAQPHPKGAPTVRRLPAGQPADPAGLSPAAAPSGPQPAPGPGGAASPRARNVAAS